MAVNFDLDETLESIRNRDVVTLARAISWIENRDARGTKLLKTTANVDEEFTPVVGVTGPPGVGKSTTIAAMCHELLNEGKHVGVIAIDPTGPKTGGALLADRLRFSNDVDTSRLFLRSVASRSGRGGISNAVWDIIHLFKLAKFDWVFIESVGSGQIDMAISSVADVVLLILGPYQGDVIQFMKGGLIDLVDCFAVNFARQKESLRLKSQLVQALQIRSYQCQDNRPISMVDSLSGSCISNLLDSISKRRAKLIELGELKDRKRSQREEEFFAQFEAQMRDVWTTLSSTKAFLHHTVSGIREGQLAPSTVAEEMVISFLAYLKNEKYRV